QVLSGLLQLFGSTGRTRSHCYRGESADLSQYLRRAPTQLDYLSQKTMVSRSPLQCQSPMSEETRVVNSQCRSLSYYSLPIVREADDYADGLLRTLNLYPEFLSSVPAPSSVSHFPLALALRMYVIVN